jgi:hypothetical protein
MAVAIAARVLAFTAMHYALAACVALGVIVVLASFSEIWVVHHPAITAR